MVTGVKGVTRQGGQANIGGVRGKEVVIVIVIAVAPAHAILIAEKWMYRHLVAKENQVAGERAADNNMIIFIIVIIIIGVLVVRATVAL